MDLLQPVECSYVGVDGCRNGWFAIGFDADWNFGFAKCESFDELLDAFCNAKLVLVDIPIGLPTGNASRKCDDCARNRLGEPRRRSVFPAPTRKTAHKVRNEKIGYGAAKKIELQTAGKGLTRQTYYISARTADVDKALEKRKEEARLAKCNSKTRVREVHPELCFWALNRGKAMSLSKKATGQREQARRERLCVLSKRMNAEEIYNDAKAWRRIKKVTGIALDDILDALVAAVTAHLGSKDKLTSIPADEQADCRGLRMEMVYWMPESA